MGTGVAGTSDPVALERAIVEVLARNPGSTAREILRALPATVRPGLARRDVNSVLYKGSGSTFVRSQDEKPRWRLVSSPAASPPPRSAGSSVDAPAPEDIARILFER